jgi:hypothetical protein
MKSWNETPDKVWVRTRRGAAGADVLVNPHTWEERPFESDRYKRVDNVEIENKEFEAYFIQDEIPEVFLEEA